MKNFLRLLIVLLVVCIGAFFWWLNGTSAANPLDKTQKEFVIAKGEGTRQIASSLRSAGLIRDPIVFFLLARFGGFDGKIEAGDFHLSANQPPSQILSTLTTGTQDVWVTIPEGFRASEIAEKLQKSLPSYDTSWNTQLQANEGYLFPDTYLFPKDASIDQVIHIMRNNFDAKYAKAEQGQTTKLSKSDIVIVASLVQREGKTDSDMQYIASVLENRLQLGMALQVDASIQYILGNSTNWWPTPSSSDLSISSSYNTYKNPGLPPAPISNPGLAALQAVLHPANTNYLYYFTDKHGVTHFAKTLDEQNANVARFGE